MDEALYTTYLEGVLRLSQHGVWHHNGTPFTNDKLSKLFHSSIRWEEDEHRYIIRIGKGRATFDCDDTAYFISGISSESSPWQITLVDGSKEDLNPHSLQIGSENQIYCTINNGHRARLMRNAHQLLLEHAVNENTLLIDGENISPKKV